MLPVTVIIPIYCQTDESLGWLNACLRSATTQDCNVALYDDGSPLIDGVRAVVADYGLRLYSSEHKGVSKARNVLASVSGTEFILPLDCDDTLAQDAVAKMYNAWAGVPIYPDIAKFGLDNDPHFRMLNFDCSLVTKYVGFTSVNVLHTVNQWKSVGMWDEGITFYEDGEYNARLYGMFCGQRYPEPLVNYRQHASQRTRTTSNQEAYGKQLLTKIRRYDMACTTCGSKNRRSTVSRAQAAAANLTAQTSNLRTSPVNIGSTVMSLPLEFEGNVLAQYLGNKGAGKHYYRGPKTGKPYRVQYGEYLYVDVADTSTDTNSNYSRLIKVVRAEPAPAPAPARVAAPKPAVVEEPVVTQVTEVSSIALPDMATMSVKTILNMVDDPTLTPELAKAMLDSEKRGLNRSKVIDFLQGRL